MLRLKAGKCLAHLDLGQFIGQQRAVDGPKRTMWS